MRLIVTILLFVFAGVAAFGQYGERPPLPPDELELRTKLENDKSIIKLTCGLLMPIDPKEMYAKEGTLRQAENTRLRLKFFKAVERHESVGLGYTCGADEGGTISKYLVSKRGKLTFVDDYSRDPFGGLRLMKYNCADLSMGHYVIREGKGIVFEEFGKRDDKGKVVFLTCTSTDRARRKLIF